MCLFPGIRVDTCVVCVLRLSMFSLRHVRRVGRDNIANRIDITLSFLQNRVNGRIFRTDLYVSTMKLACIAFGVFNVMQIAFKRRNISNKSEITRSFLQNRINGRIFRTVGLDSTPKTACIALGV